MAPPRGETTPARRALLRAMAPPAMVVADGGPGFASAARAERPRAKAQRRAFHVSRQVERRAASRPKLQAGRELCALAEDLLAARALRRAALWVERPMRRRDFRNDFPNERTRVDGGWEHAHERLGKARRSLVRLSNNDSCSRSSTPRP